MKSKHVIKNKNRELKTLDELKMNKRNSMAMGPFGSNITTDNFVPKGVPVIRGVNLIGNRFNEENFVFLTEQKADELKSSNAIPEDIVVTHRGTLGQVAIIPKNSKFKRYIISQSQMKFSCDPTLANPYYVYYYLCSNEGQSDILSHTSTTGVPAIARPLTSLKEIRIPLPSKEKQTKIVNILENIDKKIDTLKKENLILEKIIQKIFKSWFIDFDGKTNFINFELWEIPKGWEISPLS